MQVILDVVYNYINEVDDRYLYIILFRGIDNKVSNVIIMFDVVLGVKVVSFYLVRFFIWKKLIFIVYVYLNRIEFILYYY